MLFLYCLTGLLIIVLVLIKLTETRTGSEAFANYGFGGLTNNSSPPWIDTPDKSMITNIIKKIINIINSKTGMSYVFLTYDQLAHEKLCPIRTRYTVDFFVHEMRKLETRKLIMIFVVNSVSKQVDVEHINLSNAMKLPEKQFMDYPAPELILQDDNLLKNEYHIMGMNTSKIDFSILRDDAGRPKQVPTPTEFQKDYMPTGIFNAAYNPQALFPSRRQSQCWNTHGVNYIEPQTKLKIGVNNSSMFKMPYIYDNPTVNRQRQWDTEYKWLNDLNNNTSGIGRTVASSP